MTKGILKLLIGGSIKDTQTGLRGIPNELIRRFAMLPGERFEYEQAMLVESIRNNIPIREIPIETVYIDRNRETHFRSIKDSFIIYRLILKSFISGRMNR